MTAEEKAPELATEVEKYQEVARHLLNEAQAETDKLLRLVIFAESTRGGA